jgi:hypothetical protein
VFSCRDGMTGFGRTPVLPRAILVRALSAQMPRPPPRIIATALRRHETSPYVSNAQIAVIPRRLVERPQSEPVWTALHWQRSLSASATLLGAAMSAGSAAKASQGSQDGFSRRLPRRHFCSMPSIPTMRKLAYLLPTSASSACSLA